MNKIRDINFIVNRDDEMRRELECTRNKIRVATEQVINMRRQKVLYKIILKREMGVDVQPDERVDIEKEWKDRSLEKNYLQFELITLVDVLKDVDPRFHYDPEGLPTNLSSARDILITPEQLKGFIQIYNDYNVCSGQNSDIPETIKGYLDMKKRYEAQLIQNQAMIEEIKATKTKLEDLQLKAKEDKKFMTFLTTYKMQYKEPSEIKSHELHLNILTPTVGDEPPIGDDSLKYKEMWTANLKEKKQMHIHILQLNQRIELVTRRVMGTERLCLVNLWTCQKLELLPADRDYLRRKSSVDVADDRSKRMLYRKSNLLLLRNQNSYLSAFISENIIPRERDFARLHRSLKETAAEYRDIVAAQTEKVMAEKRAALARKQEEAAKATAKGGGKKDKKGKKK